jgi:NAD-dependent deacetylase
MENIYYEAADIIRECGNVVFFGGAGVSTECGIPDFRSSDGLYSKKYNYKYSPEEILSNTFFNKHPDIFYQYLRENMIFDNVNPNKGHYVLAELEKRGILKAVVTQNIDNLHQKAGSRNVLELHGSLSRYYCTVCSKQYTQKDIIDSENVPVCSCGGIIRPDVVLYEEMLDEDVIVKSVDYIQKSKVLVVAGTSLSVYPAAGYINYFKGDKLIFINKDKTPYDKLADVIIRTPFAVTMENIMSLL